MTRRLERLDERRVGVQQAAGSDMDAEGPHEGVCKKVDRDPHHTEEATPPGYISSVSPSQQVSHVVQIVEEVEVAEDSRKPIARCFGVQEMKRNWEEDEESRTQDLRREQQERLHLWTSDQRLKILRMALWAEWLAEAAC
eukprot:TRINITY_DN1274_c0_g1_i7.p2 TRINITY_DN1274_c0_g1~~TRINITY_DN1274_c0_g1_i7.p2  ORF type:complete len:140 (-),score=31.27 TRINITY_DN1274_c0_g1_i7:10-429(-)